MIVIKIGGGESIRHDEIFTNVKRLLDDNHQLVIVHGANHEMRILSEALGHPPRMVTSVSGYESRYTDETTIDIFKMVYAGKVNKSLVELCHSLGINAVGLSGVDGALLTGRRKKALKVVENGKKMIIRDDRSGTVDAVNTDLLQLLLSGGYMPLVTPPAMSEEHEAINVDGDRAAARIAAALNADALIILSDVPGLLADVNDPASLITNIDRNDTEGEWTNAAQGRMKKKIMGAIETLEAGVSKVILADARIDNPIDAALDGTGTVIS